MILRDKYGWPIVRIKGRPFANLIRIAIHTNLRKTLFPLTQADIDAARRIPSLLSSPQPCEETKPDAEIH